MSIRELITGTGMSYRQIAAETGIPAPAICFMAKGQAAPTESFLRWLYGKNGKTYHPDTERAVQTVKHGESAYISERCRGDAYRSMDAATRRLAVLRVLADGDKTARECAEALGFVERNATAPRLTELLQRDMVRVVGKKRDHITGAAVSVYRRVV